MLESVIGLYWIYKGSDGEQSEDEAKIGFVIGFRAEE